ncbi:Ferrous-iron efflux pump FieF [Aquimixticola soesokkakensis]|uniref:Ferrous-iron efflux pump FieF n=1 Tax=Aquimixticola soesokkakensis TaxID=1519096 RepID=A0A1Y5T192_9RHOB|nr:cation diffusion facilitator family transporter [Aquimixticola soesokkakensis]SLN53340.1 Ferrous-iron efflux pump FieF [Aquimixticola soesokkakensis]
MTSPSPLHGKLNLTAGLASVAVAFTLVIAKLWALYVTGSLAVGASLADSGLDLMISLAGLAAISYAARPPDEDHAYGHTSAEDLTALGQSFFILISGIAIIYTAIGRYADPTPPELSAEAAGIAVMVLSIALTLVLITFQRSVAKRTGNKVVAADSLHYVGDLIPNIGAIVSLIAAKMFGFDFIDSLVAIGAALLMISGALKIGKTALDALMDRKAPDAEIEGIAAITANFDGVLGFHDLKTRTAGSRTFVTLHIELDGRQSLYEAHEIGADLRRAIMEAYPNADVIIHKDVWFPTPKPDETDAPSA